MIDREKVINGLREMSCRETWQDIDRIRNKFQPIINGAIGLLKEQEEVEPKQVDLYGNDEWWGLICVCPDCNAEWMTDKANTHYCPNCGIRVKWE